MGSWRRCHGGTCLPVAHVLSGVDFHSPRPAHYIDCEMTTLPIARSQRQPPEVALFLWGPARHLVAGGWWLLPIMERMTLCSPWNNYSGYRFAFPPCIVSAKAMCDFQNARYVMVLHATLLLTRPLVSHKWNVARVRGMPALTMFPIVLKQLNWYNRGMSFWRLTAPVVAVLCGCRVTFSATWSSL